MMNPIQLLTEQQAYEGITHSRWGVSWNWQWRRVDDDEDRRFPSPETQMGSNIWPPDEEQEVAAAPYHKTR